MDIRAGQSLGSTWIQTADLCRGRSCSGDLDGRTCGRDSADSKTRKAGGDQCLLVQCLKIMETFTEEAETSRYYAQLAEKVRDSFTEKFWMSQKNCLKDLVSGTEADTQIRCNQIWHSPCRLRCWSRKKSGR